MGAPRDKVAELPAEIEPLRCPGWLVMLGLFLALSGKRSTCKAHARQQFMKLLPVRSLEGIKFVRTLLPLSSEYHVHLPRFEIHQSS